MQFDEIARALATADVLGEGAVSAWSIDSRTIEPGAVFFALRGERDGHQYVADVFKKGAAAAVVDHRILDAGAQFVVEDTTRALASLGRYARSRIAAPVVGITGSAGKTTTKEVIAHLLASELRVGKSQANLNNHLGTPLSLLRMPDQMDAAVIEMGMNHAGEIRFLCGIAKPDIGVVTNVGYAHVENFESIEGVAAAKRELIESLPETGTAVLNGDDERVARFGFSGRTVVYGTGENADVKATEVSYSPEGVRFRCDGVEFQSALTGSHNVLNILAGVAVGKIMGISTAKLAEAARTIAPPKMRGERMVREGITIINDCYNSNPDAAKAMLMALKAEPARRHVAVLGEMLELGRWSESLHKGIGSFAFQCGISVLIGIRGMAKAMVDQAVQSGMLVDAAYFFDSPEEAGTFIAGMAQAGDAILFKGSRGTRVELALERFLSTLPPTTTPNTRSS